MFQWDPDILGGNSKYQELGSRARSWDLDSSLKLKTISALLKSNGTPSKNLDSSLDVHG